MLSARWNIVTAARVEKARRAGKEVWAWTVNRRAELDSVRAAGVDGVAGNDPDWLRRNIILPDENSPPRKGK